MPASKQPESDEDVATLPPFMPATLIRVAGSQGVCADDLCRGLGFSPEDLTDPGLRLSQRQITRLVRRAYAAVPVPGLGLEVGYANVLGTLGILGHALTLSKTLGDALAIGYEYQELAGPLVVWRLESGSDETWLKVEPRLPEADLQLFAIEEIFASMLVYLRALVNADANPLRIECSYPEPDYAMRYAQLFRCPITFSADQNRFVVPTSLLSRAIPTHEPVALRQILDLLTTAHAAENPRAEIAIAVERAIDSSLRSSVKIDDIAADMHMSARTLRRRLQAEGLTFDAMLDEIRKKRVMSLLANAQNPIDFIAEQAGYADVRSFRRAFKRWTGMSPREYRKG